ASARTSLMLCLVTDRRSADVLEQARRAVDAGVDLIHVRERDLDARAMTALVSAVVGIPPGSRTRALVNDRAGVAQAGAADSGPLGADSIGVDAARALVPAPLLVGRSVHTVADAAAASGADYVIAGTVFASASKPDATRWLGVDGLRAIVEASTV